MRKGKTAPAAIAVVLWFVLFSPFLSGCPTDKGHPPVARLRIEPKYVPVNVDTEVLLDGRKSCDEVDHPEGCDKSADGSGPTASCPSGVTFEWSLDQAVQLLGGGTDQPTLSVRVNTDRPIEVVLKVRDCAGDLAEVRGQIGIILPFPDASVSDQPDGGI